MTAGRFSGYDDPVEVDVVLFGVIADEPKRAEAILNCGGSKRDLTEPVLDVHHVPAHFEPGKNRRQRPFFCARDPESAMDVHERRLWRGHSSAHVDVEFDVDAARCHVRDVWKDLVVVSGV